MADNFIRDETETRRCYVSRPSRDRDRDISLSLIEQELTRRWNTRTRRDASSSLFTYLPRNYDTLVGYFRNIFLSRPNDNCYISNGRRFTKNALPILLLSTFRVCSINYSLASGLPIHTRCSANADGPRAHCWNRVKWSNVRRIAFEKACNRWMTFKFTQGRYRCFHFIGHIQFPTILPW